MPATVTVTLPEMGESVTEGSIVEWRKRSEISSLKVMPYHVTTDKVDVEVPATASGVLTQILAREGQTVADGRLWPKSIPRKATERHPPPLALRILVLSIA